MKILRFLIIGLILGGNLVAQIEGDYLRYKIPLNARKIGPGHVREADQTVYNYFSPSTEISRENLVGREIYHQERLIGRELYLHGKQHGVQREWYNDGTLKSESPYKEGVMTGTFSHWNEYGALIGRYEIRNGSGIKKVYDDRGVLVNEQQITSSRPNGFWMEVSIPSKMRSFVWLKSGNNVGKSFSFYSDDTLNTITCYTDEGYLEGPHIHFSPNGGVEKRQWYLSNNEVQESEYAAAAASNPRLPRYYADADQYKQLVGEDLRALLKKYRTMQRVRIPLQFDQRGDPILAQ